MGIADRMVERVESWTGYTVARRDRVTQLEESERYLGEFADLAEDVGASFFDYMHGRPQEADATARRALSQRSRVALIRDPLAGAEADLRANFALGRGIGKPRANDEKVQEIIDEAWDDPVNSRKLTSFEAQRHRSNDLLTSANLYPVGFEHNGRTRIGFLDSDLVTDVVTHPDDDELPLYYVTRKRRADWDFDTHMPKPLQMEADESGYTEKVWYYAHWRNVEDAEAWAEETGEDPPPKPNQGAVAEGKVEHFRINRVGRTEFGIPPWARTLRFFSAMNQLTEAQVNMAQARASIIAKRVRKAGPRDLMKGAAQLMNQGGEIAAARFGRGSPSPTGPGTNPAVGGAPPPAGSHWLENEGDRLEAVNLSSGASQAAQDAQTVRAPIAASSQFGQHMLGDASNTNLSTASSLELPATMNVTSWQEYLRSVLVWFTDLAIENAVKAGRLGGQISESEDYRSGARPLPQLRLQEDRAEMEARTGLDLGYTLEMPYPGRRNLPDVVNAVTALAPVFDPMGNNPWFRRVLLNFLMTHGFQVEDPSGVVDEVMPPQDGEPPPLEPTPMMAPPGAGGQIGTDPQEQGDQSTYGERRRATPPDQAAQAELIEQLAEVLGVDPLGLGGGGRDPELVRALAADVDQSFADLLADPQSIITGRAPVRANGANGGPPARR